MRISTFVMLMLPLSALAASECPQPPTNATKELVDALNTTFANLDLTWKPPGGDTIQSTTTLDLFNDTAHAARDTALDTFNAGLKILDARNNGKSVDPQSYVDTLNAVACTANQR